VVRVVCFDLGGTVWNEERAWTEWAQWLHFSPLEFFAVLGSVIERGEHHHRAFEIMSPGIDLQREHQERKAARRADALHPEDLYPDAVPCWDALRAAGYRIGIAGNHPLEFAETVRSHYPMLDFIGSSEEWGVAKPAPEFFARIVQQCGLAPEEIAYVGDRLDNDVLPAKAAGMIGVFLRRGPWGLIHARQPEATQADIRINSLAVLPGALAALTRR
jgi:HAD superfamily hydrolase (TIGR01549 family)